MAGPAEDEKKDGAVVPHRYYVIRTTRTTDLGEEYDAFEVRKHREKHPLCECWSDTMALHIAYALDKLDG